MFTGAPTEYLYAPRWDPDGVRIVVEVNRFDSARLDASVVLQGTIGIVEPGDPPTFESLLPWDSAAAVPDWSPGGAAIAFQMPGPGGNGTEIHTIDPATGTTTRVTRATDGGGRALLPTWVSATGELIFALEERRGSDPVLAFVMSDGSGLRLVPPGPAFAVTRRPGRCRDASR